MSAATELASLLAPQLGTAEPGIHTAVPPLHLGGGPDVLEFRHAPRLPGVVHVTAGLATKGWRELVLCTRTPEPWAPALLSQLGAAHVTRRFARGGTVPLGDPGSPFAGLAFTTIPEIAPVGAGFPKTNFLVAVGITESELVACRSHGTAHVMALLARAGVFPWSVPGRATVVDPATLGPPPGANAGLSPAGQRALLAVIHGDDDGIELARTTFPASDLPRFAAVYEELIAWDQRRDLVTLISDTVTPALVATWRAFVREAASREIHASSPDHVALASALAGLDGNLGRFTRYYGDLETARATAREQAAR